VLVLMRHFAKTSTLLHTILRMESSGVRKSQIAVAKVECLSTWLYFRQWRPSMQIRRNHNVLLKCVFWSIPMTILNLGNYSVMIWVGLTPYWSRTVDVASKANESCPSEPWDPCQLETSLKTCAPSIRAWCYAMHK
jgi:hypothetical protein